MYNPTTELKALEELVSRLQKQDKASKVGIRKPSELEELKARGAFRGQTIKFDPMSRLENLELDEDSPKLFEDYLFKNSTLEATARLEQADAEG